jgi:signal transduction histidine kinase
LPAAAINPGAPARQALTPVELAELLGSFNEVTARLQRTHEGLQRQVASLQRALSEANEQLARSRRLAALGEMAAGIAHEVRNPLSSIGLYARMLEQDLVDRPEQRATAARIAAAVHGLNAVVGDVLNFARELRIRPVPASATALLDKAIESCTPREGAPRVIRHDVARGARVSCDPGLVHTALVNIIRNAYEAMAEHDRPGGHVLEVDARQKDADGEDAGCVLIIADTGPGVSADVIDRMFNPFFTTRAAGTGLGLAIVHRIVDAHAGRITVRANPAGGTVFELFLPFPGSGADAMDRDGARGPATTPADASGGRPRGVMDGCEQEVGS